MAVPAVIGVYVFDAGAWKRANAGTPIGFSGPQVFQSGAWRNSVGVFGHSGGAFQRAWANIDGELNVLDLLLTSFDFSAPAEARGKYFFNSDGTVDGLANPGTPFVRTELSQWRSFNVGRDYEVFFDEIADATFRVWDTTPTLDTWLNLTSPAVNYTYESVRTTGGGEQNRMTVRIREKVSAPAGGNDQANHDVTISIAIEP